jgi:hypothetical protein
MAWWRSSLQARHRTGTRVVALSDTLSGQNHSLFCLMCFHGSPPPAEQLASTHSAAVAVDAAPGTTSSPPPRRSPRTHCAAAPSGVSVQLGLPAGQVTLVHGWTLQMPPRQLCPSGAQVVSLLQAAVGRVKDMRGVRAAAPAITGAAQPATGHRRLVENPTQGWRASPMVEHWALPSAATVHWGAVVLQGLAAQGSGWQAPPTQTSPLWHGAEAEHAAQTRATPQDAVSAESTKSSTAWQCTLAKMASMPPAGSAVPGRPPPSRRSCLLAGSGKSPSEACHSRSEATRVPAHLSRTEPTGLARRCSWVRCWGRSGRRRRRGWPGRCR